MIIHVSSSVINVSLEGVDGEYSGETWVVSGGYKIIIWLVFLGIRIKVNSIHVNNYIRYKMGGD